MHNRRSVIKAAAGAVTVGAIDTTTASSRSWYEEVDNEAFESFKENGAQGVQQVMEEQNVSHSLAGESTQEVSEAAPQEEEAEVTPQDYHWKSNSDVVVNAFEAPGEERIRVQAMAGLKTVRPSADSVAFVPDVFGISYIGDHWSVVGEESLRTDVDEVDISLFSGTLKKGGYAAEVSHSEPLEPFINVLLAVTLRNLDGVRGQIFATYEQTRHNLPWGSGPDKIIAGGGPLQVNFGGPFSGSWSLTNNTDTDGIDLD